MRKVSLSVKFSERIFDVDGRQVEVVSIGAVANAIGRAVVYVRKLIRAGQLPGPEYSSGKAFPEKRQYWSVGLVAEIRRVANQLKIPTNNASPNEWRILKRAIEKWGERSATPSHFEYVDDDDEIVVERWEDRVAKMPTAKAIGPVDARGNYQKAPGVWSINFDRWD